MNPEMSPADLELGLADRSFFQVRPGKDAAAGYRRLWRRFAGASLFVAAASTLVLAGLAPSAEGLTPASNQASNLVAHASLQAAVTADLKSSLSAAGNGSVAGPHALTANPTCSSNKSICVYAEENLLKVVFSGVIVGFGGVEATGAYTTTSIDDTIQFSGFSHTFTDSVPSDFYKGAACSASLLTEAETCAQFDLFVPGSGGGFWISSAGGKVFGAGNASVYGSLSVSATANPVVGIASTPDGKGYWEVTRNGSVAPYGDARDYNDLPGIHVRVSNIVAIAPTADGKGYWLVGADGGEFAFGDAHFHGSIPGLHIRVDDISGMVATPNGNGYILVGTDGGVFVFGGNFYGSLPGLHKKVDNIVGILPTGAETGYVLVGSDGGAFVFGTGSGFFGSLPGRHITESNIVGIALTSNQKGYWMAGSNGAIYNFGDASYFGTPAKATSSLPISAIAGT
jgi:hypothetical protein